MQLLLKILKSLLLSCLFFFIDCTSLNRERVEIIKIDGLQSLIKEKDHQLHVINFWATWCKPCVKELPQFTALAKSHPEISISLVSLDYVQDLENKVHPFLDKKDIDLRVLLIDELDYNLWIDMVDPSWSGAIPATLILEPDTGHRIFLEKELEKNELVEVIESFTKNKL
jgi:thiol-disulfide isomerase/thioredoxin